MRERTRGGLLLLAATLLLAGCGGASKPSATHTSPKPAAPSANQTPAGSPPAAAAGILPNVVGRGLQVAQDAAQAAGFYALGSHDALGRGRHQVLDRDWKVCTQTPAPGRAPTDTTVDFGAVKLEESCPGHDAGTAAPSPAGATMPDLIGKSAEVAGQELGGNASITYKDETGQGRSVFLPSDWMVCSQQPQAGKPFNGVPVTLTVVKFGENC